MGVAGLWEVLRPAGQIRSLTELAVEDGFNANPSHLRGFRIGVDASIWFFHATYGREGENPELRTLFFRCCRLLQSPLLPLFVFDGPNRPAIKRGKRVGGNAHWLTQGMKNIIDAFGFEWRVAPGEAEAELAYLNRIGIIDAVLSDDVDNFLFGATMVIRNPSNTLSGNRAHPVTNAQGKDDGNHVVTYAADAILSNPSVALSRAGTILIGLLSGGDYIPAGLPGCGQKFATGLARAGFGDSLVKAVKERKGSRLDAFLDQWRQDIRNELKTNKSGLLPSKKPSLAASLPDDFPSLPVLLSYAEPLTSENTPQKGNHNSSSSVWRNDPDPMRIASLCELYFEWGVKDVIVHRFRTVLWPGIVCRAVRRAVVDEDTRRRPLLNGGRHCGSEGDDDTICSSSPTKRLSSALSSLALSSPSKKASAMSLPISNPPASKPFTLAALVPLTSPGSPGSSRSASPSPALTPSCPSPLLLEVLSQRTHASTDSTLEYRVLVNPTSLVERTESGVKGLRPPLVGGLFGVDPEDEDEGTHGQDADESGSDDEAGGIGRLETAAAAASKLGTKKRKARREVPTKPVRLWLPACMIRAAAPALAEVYEEKVRVREEKKAKRGTKGTRGQRAGTGTNSTSRRTKTKDADDDEESIPEPSTLKRAVGSKVKSKAIGIGSGGRRRKPKQVSEAQNDAFEYIDLSAGESPCSSAEEGVKEDNNGKGKAKTKTRRTDSKKPTTETDATNKKPMTTNTMNEFFNTTKPFTAKTTKAKSSTSRPVVAKASARNLEPLRRVYEEEEESSLDAVVPPPLPKSSRPLDLLRAKSGSVAATSNLTSKSKPNIVSTHEEEESSSSSPPARQSGSKHHSSSLPCRPAQPAPKTRKKPLFINVSDTDSDIEVSDVHCPLFGTAAAIVTCEVAKSKTNADDRDVNVRAETSTFASKNTVRVVDGVIDLTTKRIASRSRSGFSTSIPTASLPLSGPISAPLGADEVNSKSLARSLSKLDHILLPQSAIESEEEDGSEEDELPIFHCGSVEPIDTIVRPEPQPFPIQFASQSPVSPRVSTEGDKAKHDDQNDGGNMVEVVDVFTTPRGPSPPRSPTPSPLPLKPLLVHASTEALMFVRSKQSSGFPASPTKTDVKLDNASGSEQCRHPSSGCDRPISGSGKNDVLKSPRKSAAHSSPRHIPHAHGRAQSPTPLGTSKPGSMQMGDDIVRKLRLSDASAIYISSGSEDEGDAGLHVDRTKEAGIKGDRDECTDHDADTWADTAMILSAPPSPAPASEYHVSTTIPAAEVTLPNPAHTSKFKPAAAKVRPASHRITSMNLKDARNDMDTIIPCPVASAPLLIARTKRNKGRDHDIIDLTSD